MLPPRFCRVPDFQVMSGGGNYVSHEILILCWTSYGWRIFPNIPCYAGEWLRGVNTGLPVGCSVLPHGACSNLNKTSYLTASPAELPLAVEDWFSVSHGGWEACSLQHLAFPGRAARAWQRSVPRRGCFLLELLSVRAA